MLRLLKQGQITDRPAASRGRQSTAKLDLRDSRRSCCHVGPRAPVLCAEQPCMRFGPAYYYVLCTCWRRNGCRRNRLWRYNGTEAGQPSTGATAPLSRRGKMQWDVVWWDVMFRCIYRSRRHPSSYDRQVEQLAAQARCIRPTNSVSHSTSRVRGLGPRRATLCRTMGAAYQTRGMVWATAVAAQTWHASDASLLGQT